MPIGVFCALAHILNLLIQIPDDALPGGRNDAATAPVRHGHDGDVAAQQTVEAETQVQVAADVAHGNGVIDQRPRLETRGDLRHLHRAR